jgi:superfamily II DNA or RNA helicase
MNRNSVFSQVNGRHKNFSGDIVFAMVQTLQKENTLSLMPKIDLLVIDEAHHAVADTYQRIIEQAKMTHPSIKILGVTATPERRDKKSLFTIFSHEADRITAKELVASGFLVPTRPYQVITNPPNPPLQTSNEADRSEPESDSAKKSKDEPFDPKEVVRHWRSMAAGRKTVVFCTRVEFSKTVAEAFNVAGVKAAHIDGGMSNETRKTVLKGFSHGATDVLCNVSVLTEGWDHPPTSCVVLLRKSSSRAAMLQMIGRGLRSVGDSEHPGVQKTDCVVLDFGNTLSKHGPSETEVCRLPPIVSSDSPPPLHHDLLLLIPTRVAAEVEI